MEYLLIIGAALLFVTLVIVIVRGSVVESALKDAGRWFGFYHENMTRIAPP